MKGLVADPGRLSGSDGGPRPAAGGARTLIEACLERVAAVDPQVRAWISLDEGAARSAAAACDRDAAEGRVHGPLHGLPFAVKDVIDLAGYPTRAGSRSREDAPPARLDAGVVARLRAAGAIPLGKVHTTEFAYFDGVPPTRNPHDLSRTPGGSSGGPAAAVASGTVPFALGTQTAGSVCRPAAYCGIGAFKPSTLSLVGHGVTPFAPAFDTVGVFAATAADAARVVRAIAPAAMRMDAQTAPPPDHVVFLDDPFLDANLSPAAARAMDSLKAAFAEAGLRLRPAPRMAVLEEVLALHRTIILYEVSRVHAGLLEVEDRVGPRLVADIRQGLEIDADDYRDALAALSERARNFWTTFAWPGLLVLPAAPGPAPVGEATGDPRFISPMTALGGPIASIPAGHCDETGMPLGAMVCAPPGFDGPLASALMAAHTGPLASGPLPAASD